MYLQSKGGRACAWAPPGTPGPRYHLMGIELRTLIRPDLAARNLLPCLTDVRTCPDARPFVPLHSSPGRAGGTPPGEDPAHLRSVAGWLAGLPDPASPLVCYGFPSPQRVMRPLDAAQAQHHAAVA